MSEEAQTPEAEQGISKFYYTVGNHHILLEDGIKTEIIEKQNIFPIPHTPSWCYGMISLRGKLIPVASLHKILGLTEASRSKWLLVIEMAPYPQIAIRIDSLPAQQLIDMESQEALKHSELPHWFDKSLLVEEKTFYSVNHAKLFEQLIQQNEVSRTDLQEA